MMDGLSYFEYLFDMTPLDFPRIENYVTRIMTFFFPKRRLQEEISETLHDDDDERTSSSRSSSSSDLN